MMDASAMRRVMRRGVASLREQLEVEMATSDSDTGEGDGSGSDGAPDQPEKYLHCRYSGYIAQVEAPDPVESHGKDEGPSFC